VPKASPIGKQLLLCVDAGLGQSCWDENAMIQAVITVCWSSFGNIWWIETMSSGFLISYSHSSGKRALSKHVGANAVTRPPCWPRFAPSIARKGIPFERL
jgi:hypothetical protein